MRSALVIQKEFIPTRTTVAQKNVLSIRTLTRKNKPSTKIQKLKNRGGLS